MIGQLLTTKLYIPSVRESRVSRPRLLQRLDDGLAPGVRLALVSGPAGFGKTTLLAEWSNCQSPLPNLKIAWLSLDEHDNDLTRFRSYVIAALQTALADVGQAAEAMLRAAPPAPIEAVLTALINDAYAARAMQVTYSVPGRIWAFFKASIFSPLNGWQVYLNNKKTTENIQFMAWVTTDATLSQTLPRMSRPTLLIYGAQDLFAPVQVGQLIYRTISTPESQKTLLILPNSRHGAEGVDIPVMQKAIRDFINHTIVTS